MKANRETLGVAAPSQMPLWVFILLVAAAFLIMLFSAVGGVRPLAGAVGMVLSDGVMALLILLAAGGYGYVLLRAVGPEGLPAGLSIATSLGVGLWLLSTAMFLAGSFVPGCLQMAVWWPVIVLGGLLAIIQGYRSLRGFRLPGHVSGGGLIWVLISLAAGLWVAGACLPPGWLGRITADSYDILEYHLQVPREFFDAGRISTLDHNIYSHYPLGSEMLFLLAMCLRGGPYLGAYLAQFTSGLFGIVAVLAVFSLRSSGPVFDPEASDRGTPGPNPDARPVEVSEDLRGRFAAVLLASSPWVIYLSWLAMEEMGQICFMTLAAVWLRTWLLKPQARSAACVGLMLGFACCFKYLSVGFIAAPVLVVMLAFCLKAPRRLKQWALAAVVAAAVFSPWLIRNVAATRNPVFPLAMNVFGHDKLPEEDAARWDQAHRPTAQPPVPEPAGWKMRPQMPRVNRFTAFFLGQPATGQPPIGALTALLLAGAVAVMVFRPRGTSDWDWALLGILVLQLVVWTVATRDMPARFLSVSIPVICLLSAGGLVRLAGVREVGFLRQSGGTGGRWGVAPAVLLLAAAGLLNLLGARAYYRAEPALNGPGGLVEPPVGIPVKEVAARLLVPNGRFLLVGQATAFLFPADTLYATAFNEHPLERILRDDPSNADVAARLRQLGVTHVLVDWAEIDRLTNTYGWPAAMSAPRLLKAFAGWPVIEQIARSNATAPATATTSPGAGGGIIYVSLLAVPPAPQATTETSPPATTRPAAKP